MNLVIVVYGGIVQNVLADSPHPEIELRIKVLDYDTEGNDVGVIRSPIDGSRCVIGELAAEINPETVQKIYAAEPEYIWVRMGDASEYEHMSDLHEAGLLLMDYDIRPETIQAIKNGITAPGFEGRNYISLFWGDQKTNLIRGLTDEEIEELKRFAEPV